MIFGENAASWCRWFTYGRLRHMLLIHNVFNFQVLKYRVPQYFLGTSLSNTIMAHFFVCLWYQMSCHHGRCNNGPKWYENTWAEKLIKEYPEYLDASVFDYYTLCVYTVLQTYFCIGLGDIVPGNYTDTILISFCTFSGFILLFIWVNPFTFVLAFILKTQDRAKFIFQEMSMNRYLEEVNVDKEVIRKLQEYCQMLWKKKGGIKKMVELKMLPKPLRMEIMHDINYTYLHRSLLFNQLKDYLFRTLSLLMTSEFLLPGDIMFYQDVVKKSMIIIRHGVLEILSEEDDESPIIAFKPGTVLGEASLYLTLPSKATVRAAVYTEVVLVNRVEFIRTMVNYPIAFEAMRNKILKRITLVKSKKMNANREQTVKLDGTQPNVYVPIKIIKELLHAQEDNKEMNYDPTSAEALFNRNMLSLYQISDFTSNIEIPVVILTWKFPWILDCTSSLILFWEIVVICSHLPFLIIYPYQVVFLRHLDDVCHTLRFVSDAMNIFDVVFLTLTSVVMRERTLRTFREIIRYRLKSFEFYISMLPIFPYEFLVHIAGIDDGERVYNLLWSIKLFRFVRCFMLLEKYRAEYYFQNVAIGMLLMIFYTVLCVYYTGCILYLYTCLFDVCTENSWFYQLIMKAVRKREEKPCYFYPLASSMYFSASLLLGPGFGDIVPIPTNDIQLAIVIFVGGLVFLLFIRGYLGCIIHNNGSGSEVFKDNMEAFKRYLNHYQVPAEQKFQALNFFNVQWDYDRSIGRVTFDEMAPNYLKMVVSKEELSQLLSKVPLFQKVDLDFLMDIMLSLKVQVLPAGSTICFSGDIDREMFIILKGSCIATDSKGAYLKDLVKRDFVGDIEMLFNLKKMFSVVTVTTCKIASVTYRSYMSSLSMFPDELAIVRHILNHPEVLENVNKMALKRQQAGMRKRKRRQLNKSKEYFTKIRSSFILTYRRHKETGGRERYWAPFRKMKRWQFVGLFLVPITISPDSWVLKGWFVMRCTVLCVMGVFFSLIFGLPLNAGKYFFVVQWVEVTAYIELYLLMHVAYYDEHGLLISHPKYTAWNYITHGLLVDLVAALPYYAIVTLTHARHDDSVDPLLAQILPHYMYCPWRAMMLLQYHRFLGVFYYLRSNIRANSLYVFGMIIMFIYLVVLPVLTTIFINDANYKFFDHVQPQYENHITYVFHSKKDNVTYYGYLISQKSWFATITFKDDPLILVVTIYYYVTSVFNNVAVGDISAYDDVDMYIVIGMVISSMILTSYALAFWWEEAKRSKSNSLTYTEKLDELTSFLRREKMPESLIAQVSKYFAYLYNRTIGLEKQAMLSELYSALKGDICLYLYEKPLKETAFFKTIGRPYLRVISKQFAEDYFMKGDVLIKSYDVHDNIYLILRGKIDILTPYDELIATLGVGSVVGNIHAASHGCSSITVRARRNVDVLVMSSERFQNLMQYYPSVKRAVKKILATNVGEYIVPASQQRESVRYSALDDVLELDEAIIKGMERTQSFEEIDREKLDATTYKTIVVIPKGAFRTFLLFFKPKNWFHFALEPNHPIFITFRTLVCLAAYFQAIIIPYMFVTQSLDQSMLIVSLVLEPLFYLRIFFSLHEAYLDEYGLYVKKFRVIAEHYKKDRKRIALDVVPNVPLYLFFVAAPISYYFYVFTILRMFQLLRIIYIYLYFRKAILVVKMPKELREFMFAFIFYSLLVHYLSLICLYIVTHPPEEVTSKFYLLVKDASLNEAYWYSFYYVMNFITRIGNGDLIPETRIMLSFSNVLLFVSLVGMFYLTRLFLSTLIIMHLHILNYEDTVNRMKRFLTNQGISNYLLEKLGIYITDLYRQEKGSQIPEFLETKVHYVLKCEIMRQLYSKNLKDSYIFKGINEALLVQICGCLKRVVFFKGNYIVQNGDVDSSMYWIHRGLVSVLTVHPNLTETRHELLHEHEMFGLKQGLNYGFNHSFSYRAETTCDILILSLPSWEHVLEHFPHDKEVIHRRMLNVYNIV